MITQSLPVSGKPMLAVKHFDCSWQNIRPSLSQYGLVMYTEIMTLSADKRKGTLFIISAPSGTGKTSLVSSLVESVSDLSVSISHTTRSARPHEQHGVDYYFVSEDEFECWLGNNRFLEHATVYAHRYGTARAWVEEQLAGGTDIILEIDWQGAQQARSSIKDAVSIFILPPSLMALEERLRGRGDDKRNIQRRLQATVSEIEHYHEYDYLVVNDSFDKTLEQLIAILVAVRHNCGRQAAYYKELLRKLLQRA